MDLSWNLNEIYENNAQIDDDLVMLKRLGDKIILTKGSLNSHQGVLNYFKESERFEKLLEKLDCYLYLTKSLDGSNVYAIEKLAELETFMEDFSSRTTFAIQELKKLPSNTLRQWSKLPEFADYDNELLDLIKAKKHTLSEKCEKLMIGAGYTASQSDLFDALNNVELKYGNVKDEQGNTIELTNANYYSLIDSKVRSVRKQATLKMLKAYKSVNQTLSTNYLSYVKYKNFVAKAYKYKSTLDMCLQGSDLPDGLPNKVVEYVTNHLNSLYSYYNWRKKYMKLPKFESWDLGCNLFDETVSKKYSIKEGLSLIKKALKPLGKDYTDMLDYAVQNNWIDSGKKPNKESGAYNLGLYGYHPFILLSYDNTLDSVRTIAHEFGHAMHSYYSTKNQPYAKHSYGIFLAEVASTVNEVLLSHYNISHAQTTDEKINYITSFLNNFIGTIFTQTKFTEFELYVHECINIGEPLSYKKLNDYFYLLQKKYSGKAVSVVEDTKYNWSRIPHFYRSFYVFKYATGLVAACAIAQKLLTDPSYKYTYLNYLSLGSSKKPCEALKFAGVDILDKKTYDSAFKLFDDYLSQLQELTK